MTKPPLTLQMPPPPDPVPVVLHPATTALLIFDIVDPICSRQPNCTGTNGAGHLVIAGAGAAGWCHRCVWD